MKDYQKIYKRLVKEIKAELACHKIALSKNSLDDFQERCENKYGITVLNWILSTLDEIEGRNCNGTVLMNQKEFKKWKKQIEIEKFG